MNGQRQHIEQIWSLPYTLEISFSGRDGAPERQDLKPVLRYEGQEDTLCTVKVADRTDTKVTLLLGAELAKYGLARYELCVHTTCCQECDCVKLEFKGDCAITGVTGHAHEESCDVRY